MNARLPLMVGCLAMILLLAVSCSGGGQATDSSPLAPQFTPTSPADEAGHYLWAYYTISVDTENNTYEIVPVRNPADHWNVLKFLEKGPCTNCVKIVNVTPTGNGTKIFDVQISHPFPNPTFTGFDVRGIAMFAGSHTFPLNGLTTPDRFTGDGELVNADGYTTLYNGTTAGSGPGGLQGYIKGKFTPPSTPNSLLNGFKRHTSPGVGNTRNVFYAGTAVLASYELDMPDTSFVFGYAVDASWAAPTTTPVTNPINDFPPEANCPEPWKIDVTQNPIGQGLTDQGGQTELSIDVYDYQGKASIFAPVLECNELFGGTMNAIFDSDGVGYTRFKVTVPNEKIAAQGTYKCLVKVEDTENVSAPPYLDLSAYQIVPLEVGEFIPQGNLPPTAAAHVDNSTPQPNQPVNFFDDSTDPDGASDIVKWEWDFSFDAIDGFTPGSEEQNPSVSYPTPGTYNIQLRVTDSELHTDLLNTPLSITVQGSANEPPIACGDASSYHVDIKIPPTPVNFYDCSYDPDGISDISLYEWDTDGDSNYDKFGANTTKTYVTAGDFLVQHRVTDTAANVDTLDVPILIEVNGKPLAQAEADQTEIAFGDNVTITNSSVDDDGNGAIVEMYWDTNGDGNYTGPEDISGANQIILTFYQAGTHNIGLKVVDEYGLVDTLDTPVAINVTGFDPFCVGLIDQWNSADQLYQTRTFKYYNDSINQLSGLDYKAPTGPWDFNEVPAAPPAICKWLLPNDPEVAGPKALWPDADFFFKETAPGTGYQYVPHKFIFDSPGSDNGTLLMQGQYDNQGNAFDYGDTFQISHQICQGWTDGGSGSATLAGVNFDVSWQMTALGTGPAIFTVNGNQTILNCMLIRHNISFVDTDFGVLSFSLLNYQWIDSDGNEVAFMQADNGLQGNNYSGNTYTGQVICRALQSIS